MKTERSERISRIKKLLGANSFAQLATIGIQLATIPLFVHYWGSDRFGQWLFLLAATSLVSISDFGISTVYGNRIAKLWINNQRTALERAHRLALNSIVRVCGLSATVVFFVLHIYFSLQDGGVDTLRVCTFGLLCFYNAANVPMNHYGNILKATWRNAPGIYIVNSIRLFEWIAAATALALGANEAAVAAAYLISRLAGLHLIVKFTNRDENRFPAGITSESVRNIGRLIYRCSIVMSFPLALNLSLNGTVLIIGHNLGSSAVTSFSAMRTLTRLLIQASAIFSQAVWPEFTALHTKGNLEKLRSIHASLFLWNGIVCILGAASVQILGPWVIEIWTNNRVVLEPTTFFLLGLTAFASSLWQGSWVFLLATNQSGVFAKNFLRVSVLFVIFSAVLSNYGLPYVAMSLLLCESMLFYFATTQALKKLQETPMGQWKRMQKIFFEFTQKP